MPGASEATHPANVLLVDDTPANLQVLGGMLKEQGCVVRPVPSGKLAIRFAQSDPPDIILLDIMMPEMDGYEVCRRLKEIDGLKDIPIIFISALQETIDKVRAFAAGGVDYITKPFQFQEVQARLRTHLNIRRLQVKLEDQNRQLIGLNQALHESQQALESELTYAANYVLSLIPPPIREGDIQTEWRYVPSARLGGDSLGYHWIDNSHFALYLLDVSSHGVGPALLSISVLNALRSQCLPDADFRHPEQVLTALNARFPRKDQYGHYFTIWYGVFSRKDRMLRYVSGGHPPAALSDSAHRFQELESLGLPVGLFPDTKYVPAIVEVPPEARLYVFSDGCYEVRRGDGEEWTMADMINYLRTLPLGGSLQLDGLYQHLLKMQSGKQLEDDFSIVRATFL